MPLDFCLADAGLGAVEERFEVELNRVIENVVDLNTDPTKKREIIIKFTYSPSKQDRTFGEMTTLVTSKLAPLNPLVSGFSMGITENGECKAREHVQQSFDFESYETADGNGPGATLEEADNKAKQQVNESKIKPFTARN